MEIMTTKTQRVHSTEEYNELETHKTAGRAYLIHTFV